MLHFGSGVIGFQGSPKTVLVRMVTGTHVDSMRSLKLERSLDSDEVRLVWILWPPVVQAQFIIRVLVTETTGISLSGEARQVFPEGSIRRSSTDGWEYPSWSHNA